MSRNEVLKKRYQVYRRLGYDSNTSRALSQRSLDVSKLEISEKTGKLKANSNTKKYFETDMREWKQTQAINKYGGKYRLDPEQPELFVQRKNDTNYTAFGTITHDKRYRGENGKIVSIIKHENNLSTNQAYYFLYTMLQSGMTYKQTQKQLLSNKEFEQYDRNKKGR